MSPEVPVPKSDDDSEISVRQHPRYSQMFPVLSDQELERVRRFGCVKQFAAGDMLYRAGSLCPGVFVLLSGKIRIVGRDGLGRQRTLHIYQRRGEFTSDVTQLTDSPAVVDAHVEEAVEAILLRPAELSALMIREANIGETLMRALILRRVLVVERGHGVVLLGPADHSRLLTLQDFLRRNSFPSVVMDARSDPEGIALLERLHPEPHDYPLVICPDGTILHNPEAQQLASCLGLIPDFDPSFVYDVAVVGAGPAGLATAVYAASEGLSVAVLDGRAPGGQAGTSARIENFLGFPTGISGHALAGRAFVQAQKFGAHIGIPCLVKSLACSQSPLVVELTTGVRISARSVVIATGAEYRRPAVEGLERYESCGIYFWATPIEGKLCRNRAVLLVGGGNSAGQAAVFLSSQAAHVHMFVRAESLDYSMSRYLIERVRALPNLTLHTGTELIALEGDHHLESVRYRGIGGIEGTMTVQHLFLFIGANPNTSWLKSCDVKLDSKGFVLTGGDVPHDNEAVRPLQTNVKGVFAIGDVRCGSNKRVASAVGEGAAVVAQVHQFLAER